MQNKKWLLQGSFGLINPVVEKSLCKEYLNQKKIKK